MRLLHTNNYKLENFEAHKTPLYAILSHRWGDDEITFQDIDHIELGDGAGYEKVRKTCSIARAHGFDYVWIDTCCIDKTSSAELSEAINSMYRWYQESGVCYAYLDDVLSNAVDRQTRTVSPLFSESKWFNRGWTLQELIAPSMVIFLDQAWQEIGTKSSLQLRISEITRIPDTILQGADPENASVAQRMSWASKRETKRLEDLAYCLMGIFGINMPLLYGEGERAFTRLQEEIMRVSDDYSLFAWKSSEKHGSLLATSPAAFSNSGEIVPFNLSSTISGDITVSNKGVHLKLPFRTVIPDVGLAILPCIENGKLVAIYLRAMSESEEFFVRTMSDKLVLHDLNDFSQSEYRAKSICVRQERWIHKNKPSLPRAAANGNKAVVKLLLEKGAELEAKDGYSRTPLSCAVANGHEAVVKLLLEKGAELEAKDKDSQTPLSYAAENGHEAVVKLLLERGAELEEKDDHSCTPLLKAVKNGHEVVVKLLLEKGAELEVKSNHSQTPLSYAAENGHEAIVKLLVEKGAELEAEDIYHRTPLSYAAEKGYKVVVKLFLEKDTELESKDDYSRTPLLRAAENGHEAVVKLLLEKGAELETKDYYSQTPLLRAAENGHEAVVKLLLEKGAELEEKDIQSQTPLLKAVKNRHETVVKLLLEKGAKLEAKDYYNQRPLLFAATNGHEAVVKLLLEKGAELEAKDNYSQTPLLRAAEHGHKTIVKLLLEKGVELEAKDNFSQTSLSHAAQNGHKAVVKLLVEKGAKLDPKDNVSRTPLSYAAEKGHEAVVKLLVEEGAELKAKDGYNRTPLSHAVQNSHVAVVKLLLEKVAGLEVYNNSRMLFLWAAENGYENVIDLLLKRGASTYNS